MRCRAPAISVPPLATWPGSPPLSTRGNCLTDGSLRLLRTPHAPVGTDDGSGDGWLTSDGYGYGQFVGTIAGQTAYFHPGDNPGYQSFAAWIPADAACVVILTNDETTSIEGLLKQLL